MLENHPLLIEKESYMVKYLNVLEYFSQKYSANDPWANQTLQLYIKKPVFRYNGVAGEIEVTPCSLVSGNELAIHMGLPRHSVCGLPVIEHTDFGKEIVTYDGTKQSSAINLGNIFNMGNVCNNKVSLNLNSLAMHTFITGSTGSGKSNTVYEIVRQLDIPALS